MTRYNEKRTTTREELSGIAQSLRLAAAGIQAIAQEMKDLEKETLDVKYWKSAIEAVDKASKFSAAVVQAVSVSGVDQSELAAITQRNSKGSDQESRNESKPPKKREKDKLPTPPES